MSSQLFDVHHTPRLSDGRRALPQEVTLSLHYFSLIKGNGIMPLHSIVLQREKFPGLKTARKKGHAAYIAPMRISLNSVEKGIMMHRDFIFRTVCRQIQAERKKREYIVASWRLHKL